MGIAKALALEPRAWTGTRRKAAAILRPVTAAGALDIALVDSRDALARLEAEWTTLWNASEGASGLFLGFNWVWNWCQHYLDIEASGLAIVTARRNGRLVMVWPLVLECQLGLRTASFLGAPVSQYGDVLVDRTDDRHMDWVEESWNYITAQLAVDLVHLRKVRADSAVAVMLARVGAKASNEEAAPYIALAGEASFEAFDQRFSAKDRKNRRRKRKRLGEQGAVGFRRSNSAPAATQALRQAMVWKRDWIEDGSHVSTAIADQRFDGFFAALLSDDSRTAGVETFELTLDGRPVAIKVAVTCGSYRGMHLTAYDRAHEKCSPGALLVEEMIGAGLADGVKTLDFLAPAFGYKLEWASGTVTIADYCVPVTVMGQAYQELYVRRLRPRLKSLAAEGPAPIRRLISGAVKLMGNHGS